MDKHILLERSQSTIGPKVSILTITYNQEHYIRQTLESLVAQITDFNFEIVISDDCSTDGTPEIIKEYIKKYPNIFKATLRKKNVGAWENFLGVLRGATGKYIALCEGDDYWTDKSKIQIQADFLDKNPDYGMCFHPVKVFFENNEQKEYIYPDSEKQSKFTVGDLLKDNFIQTNSVMYRRQSYTNMPIDIMPGDWYLHLYHAQFGKIGFINKTMSAYRRHPGGIWWNDPLDKDKIVRNYGIQRLSLSHELLKLYGKDPASKEVLFNNADEYLRAVIVLSDKEQCEKAIKLFPKFVIHLLGADSKKLGESNLKYQQAIHSIEILKEENAELKSEKGRILKSKTYLVGKTILAAPRKIKSVVSRKRP